MINHDRTFDLLVVTPNREELNLVGHNYADSSLLDRALPIRLVMDRGAAALILTPLRDLPIIADRLLPLCGFGSLSRIAQVRQPTSADATEAEFLIIAQRHGSLFDLPAIGPWLADSGPLAVCAVAEKLYPDAKRKLHVFASAPADGWSSLIGGACWVEKPSIR